MMLVASLILKSITMICTSIFPPVDQASSVSSTSTRSVNLFNIIFYANCRSVLSKLYSLRIETEINYFCVIVLTETWLDAIIFNYELFLPGYSLVHLHRNCKGGEILMYTKNSLSIVSVTLTYAAIQ